MRRAVGRDNRDGGGPSLASGEMYSYSLRRVKQGMDPGDALASSRALSNLASNADDVWSLLAIAALAQPLPHTELLAGPAFSKWVMDPEPQRTPAAPSTGRRAGGRPRPR